MPSSCGCKARCEDSRQATTLRDNPIEPVELVRRRPRFGFFLVPLLMAHEARNSICSHDTDVHEADHMPRDVRKLLAKAAACSRVAQGVADKGLKLNHQDYGDHVGFL